MPGEIWIHFIERGWSIRLDAAARRFTCTGCGRSDQIQVLPASRVSASQTSWDREVSAFFHASRAARKRKLRRVR